MSALGEQILSSGIELLKSGNPIGATEAFLKAAVLAPNWAEPRYQLALVHFALNAPTPAEQALREALALDPNHAGAAYQLGLVLVQEGDTHEALAFFQIAANAMPGVAGHWRELGIGHLYLGNWPEARAALLRALQLDPLTSEVIDLLARLQPIDDEAEEAKLLAQMIERMDSQRTRYPSHIQAQILFARGSRYEAQGRYDDAFACFNEANRICRSAIRFNIEGATKHMANIASVFSHATLSRLSGLGSVSDRPIFIVGMPRSGTTLVEQIVCSHHSVLGGTERNILPKLLSKSRGSDQSRYPNWVKLIAPADCRHIGDTYLSKLPKDDASHTRYTDKWPENFLHLGLIWACLPNATVIHCMRDPRDMAVSAYSMRFSGGSPYIYDLAELGTYWRAYSSLMSHWRSSLPEGWILDVPYEELVADPDRWVQRIIAHCKLDWDPVCLRFHETKREVRTSSYMQVRRPIYSTSVGRWKRFQRHLGSLLESLELQC